MEININTDLIGYILLFVNNENIIVNYNKNITDITDDPDIKIKNKNINLFLPDNIDYQKIVFGDFLKTHFILNGKKFNIKIIKIKKDNETTYVMINILNFINNKYMANFSHEIRTPLNSIIGMISLFYETNLNEEQMTYLDMLNESSNTLLKIINDILDYSKLESGNLILNNEIFYLRDCIETSHDIVLYHCKEKNIKMIYNIDNNVPDFIIGDPIRIRQILLNLYYNSIKFSHENGEIYTHVSLFSVENINKNENKNKNENENENDNIIVKFSIKDNGIGILDKNKYKIFESYHTLDNQLNSSNQEGIGLGLAISKELSNLMGGDIWLENSICNKGSEFCFTIKTKSKNDQLNIHDINLDILKGKNVLIIDDNLIHRMNICNLLLKWKMSAFPCSSVDEGMLFIKNHEFDIIMIDIRLPKEDGISLGKKIRKLLPNIPLIAMSSIGNNINNYYINIFDFYIIKPIKENKLLSICYKILQQSNNKLDIDNISVSNSNSNSNTNTNDISILIDEDIYINQYILKNFLDKLNYKNIYVVNNGREAIDILNKKKFDICFIDIKTPILSGYDVLSYIKNNNLNTYCIALTAIANKYETDKKYDFDDYLYKPIKLSKLESIFKRYLESI